MAGGCCAPRMTYFARRHIGLLSEVVPSWNVVWFGCVFIILAYVKGGDVVCCLKS